MAVFGDLHQVTALAGTETIRAPVVEYQQVTSDELPEQTREMTTIKFLGGNSIECLPAKSAVT